MRIYEMLATATLLGIALAPAPTTAQSVMERTPNLSGGWVPQAHALQFNFLHRFQVGDAPARKVTNWPTFLMAYGLSSRAMVSLNYASNSDVALGKPNEWELMGRLAPLSTRKGDPIDLSVSAAFNEGNESVDGEVAVVVPLGRLRLLGTARVFSSPYAEDDGRIALGGGANLRLGEYVALSADLVSLLDREEGEDVAWGVGVQLGLPFTPHSFSLQATNTTTGTLQGSSRGRSETLYGFEFTIPLTPSRFFGSPEGDPQSEDPALREVSENTVVVVIENINFGMKRIVVPPGTRVVWVNRDPVAHTSTADGGQWDSGLIAPGESWSMVFDELGSFSFHCTPHPFMTGVVEVRQDS